MNTVVNGVDRPHVTTDSWHRTARIHHLPRLVDLDLSVEIWVWVRLPTFRLNYLRVPVGGCSPSLQWPTIFTCWI